MPDTVSKSSPVGQPSSETLTYPQPMFDESRELFLNGIQIEPVRILGLSQNPNAQVSVITESKLNYLCGNNIVRYDLMSGAQQIITLGDENQITLFRVFKNNYNQQILIFATKTDTGQTNITVANHWRSIRDQHHLHDLEKDEVISDICYLAESCQIICLSKTKTTAKITILQERRHNFQFAEVMDTKIESLFQDRRIAANFLYFTASQIFRCQYTDSFKQQKVPLILEYSEKILCCSSLSVCGDSNIVCATDRGILYIVMQSKGEILIQKQSLVPSSDSLTHRKPSAVYCADMFILVGYQETLEITCFKISNLSFKRRIRKDILLGTDNLYKIQQICVSQQQSIVCVLVQMKGQSKYGKHNRIYGAKDLTQNTTPGRLVPIILDFLLYETSTTHQLQPFTTLFDNIVCGKQIMQVCMCATKDLVLVLSSDKRVSAYRLGFPQKLPLDKMHLWSFQFNDCGVCMDMHPVNHSVVVAFKSEIKLYSISLQGLRYMSLSCPVKSQFLKYSQSGHLLAAASGASILLFNPYSFQVSSVISFHNSNPRSIKFLNNDEYLLLQSKHHVVLGSVLGQKLLDHSNRNLKITALTYDAILDLLVVSYSEGFTKFLRNRGNRELGTSYHIPFYFTEFIICNQYNVLFAGTSKGSIRVYQWPFSDVDDWSKSFVQIRPHEKAVVCMKITFDLRHIVSCSEDGSVVISKLKHYSNGFLTPEHWLVKMLHNESKYQVMSALVDLTLDCRQEQGIREQTIQQTDASKMSFKEGAESQLMSQKLIHNQSLKQLESRRIGVRNTATEEYKSSIDSYQKLKKQCASKLAAIGLEFKQLDSLKQKLDQETEQVYASRLKLCAQKDRLEGLNGLKTSSLAIQYCNKSNESNSSMGVKMGDYRQVKKLELFEIDEETNEQKQGASMHFSEVKMDKGDLADFLARALQQEQNKKEQIQKQNRYLSNHIGVYRDREQKTTSLKETLSGNMQQLISQKLERKRCLLTASNELSKRDQIILGQQGNLKRHLKFNLYQMEEEVCLKHNLDQLGIQNYRLAEEYKSLDDKKHKIDDDLIRQNNSSKELTLKIQQLRCSINRIKTSNIQMNQKLFVKRQKFSNIGKQIELIISSGDDIKSQLLGIIDRLDPSDVLPDTDQGKQDGRNSRPKEVQRNGYTQMIGGAWKLHQVNKTIFKSHQNKTRSQATLLTCEYNRLKFEQVDLKQTLHYMSNKFQAMKREQLMGKTTGIFTTAIPENETRSCVQTPSVKKNIRNSKLHKGVVKYGKH